MKNLFTRYLSVVLAYLLATHPIISYGATSRPTTQKVQLKTKRKKKRPEKPLEVMNSIDLNKLFSFPGVVLGVMARDLETAALKYPKDANSTDALKLANRLRQFQEVKRNLAKMDQSGKCGNKFTKGLKASFVQNIAQGVFDFKRCQQDPELLRVYQKMRKLEKGFLSGRYNLSQRKEALAKIKAQRLLGIYNRECLSYKNDPAYTQVQKAQIKTLCATSKAQFKNWISCQIKFGFNRPQCKTPKDDAFRASKNAQLAFGAKGFGDRVVKNSVDGLMKSYAESLFRYGLLDTRSNRDWSFSTSIHAADGIMTTLCLDTGMCKGKHNNPLTNRKQVVKVVQNHLKRLKKLKDANKFKVYKTRKEVAKDLNQNVADLNKARAKYRISVICDVKQIMTSAPTCSSDPKSVAVRNFRSAMRADVRREIAGDQANWRSAADRAKLRKYRHDMAALKRYTSGKAKQENAKKRLGFMRMKLAMTKKKAGNLLFTGTIGKHVQKNMKLSWAGGHSFLQTVYPGDNFDLRAANSKHNRSFMDAFNPSNYTHNWSKQIVNWSDKTGMKGYIKRGAKGPLSKSDRGFREYFLPTPQYQGGISPALVGKAVRDQRKNIVKELKELLQHHHKNKNGAKSNIEKVKYSLEKFPYAVGKALLDDPSGLSDLCKAMTIIGKENEKTHNKNVWNRRVMMAAGLGLMAVGVVASFLAPAGAPAGAGLLAFGAGLTAAGFVVDAIDYIKASNQRDLALKKFHGVINGIAAKLDRSDVAQKVKNALDKVNEAAMDYKIAKVGLYAGIAGAALELGMVAFKLPKALRARRLDWIKKNIDKFAQYEDVLGYMTRNMKGAELARFQKKIAKMAKADPDGLTRMLLENRKLMQNSLKAKRITAIAQNMAELGKYEDLIDFMTRGMSGRKLSLFQQQMARLVRSDPQALKKYLSLLDDSRKLIEHLEASGNTIMARRVLEEFSNEVGDLMKRAGRLPCK